MYIHRIFDGLFAEDFQIVDDSDENIEKVSYNHSFIDGALRIPTFDQYITASKLLSSTDISSIDFFKEIGVADDFTNLLYFGDLHFAPEVRHILLE